VILQSRSTVGAEMLKHRDPVEAANAAHCAIKPATRRISKSRADGTSLLRMRKEKTATVFINRTVAS
jgi:hypothetical protein